MIEFKPGTIPFDVGKQAAIVGWCLRDHHFCEQALNVLKRTWFTNTYAGDLFQAIADVHEKHHRVMTVDELRHYDHFQKMEAAAQKRIRDTVDEVVAKTEVFRLDLLRQEMDHWVKTTSLSQSIQEIVKLFNAQKIEEAWQLVEDTTLFKARMNFESKVAQKFQESASQILSERESRLRDRDRVLKYHVKFLDDALGGIIPNDLVLLGAKTGAGKTQLAVSIALGNSQALAKAGVTDRFVHYFALEAEQHEIERRIKFGYLSGKHYLDPAADKNVDYPSWRMGKAETLLGKTETDAVHKAEMVKTVSNLKTYYRTDGDFGAKEMERQLLKVIDESALIVIDHLHYIDVDSKDDNENAAYKRVIKLIRDIVLRYGVPVIVVAHLRKNQNFKQAPLVNSIEDFHGTSDVPKIATTAIMIGSACDQMVEKPYLRPTYLRVAKSRLDGSRSYYTGLCYFDSRTFLYEDSYHIGVLTNGDTEFKQFDPALDPIPYWAHPILPKLK